jgi:beta-lactam-binding protein with PASTA domain
MLTGRVPFNGETTVAIAIKHIQSPMPSPKEFVPDIPRSVEQIVLKCCEKSPDRRYQNMNELIGDLKQSLIHPNDDFVKIIDPDEDGATRMANPVAQAQARRKAGSAAAAAVSGYSGTVSAAEADAAGAEKYARGVSEDRRTVSAGSEAGGHYPEQADYPQAGYSESNYPESEYVEQRSSEQEYVPEEYEDAAYEDAYSDRSYGRSDYAESSYDQADYVDAYEVRSSRSRGNYDDRELRERRASRQSRQDRIDEPLRKNSRYKDSYEGPSYRDNYNPGREKAVTAISILAAVLIGVVIILFAASKLGLLSLGSSGDGQETAEESDIVLPQMVGKSADEVQNSLKSLGLIPEVIYEESDEYDSGVVMTASFQNGTVATEGASVEAGTSVILKVSAGQSGIEVPDVTGKSQAEAIATLKQKGFDTISKVDGVSNDVEKGQIISQSPVGGALAPTDTTITLTICTGPDTEGQVQVPSLTGRTTEEAMAILTEKGLSMGATKEVETTDEAQVGKVIAQNVKAESYVDPGTEVDLTVGKAAKAATYSCSTEITAPTAEEAPDYTAGTQVYVVIITADSQTLMNTVFTTFPQPASFTGISCATGTLQMSYAPPAADAVNGQRVITRQLVFTPED